MTTLPDSGDFESSLEAKYLVLRGQLSSLATDCQRSSEAQGERIGRLEQDLRACRENYDLFRQRQEHNEMKISILESRLLGGLAVLTGAVGIVELLRQIL